jgi:DNA-binding transcriptional LysR family regulator
MDLEELRAFLRVADSGSFLAAADALGVSRTTLRRRVGSLEARTGVPLLESTQQGVVLTDAGRVLARRGRALEEDMGALLASVREVGQEPAGVLRISMPVGLPPHVLTPLVAALRASYPLLSLEGRHSDDPIGESLAGVDMAVHFCDSAPRGKWISYVMIRVPERLVAAKGYLARRGTPRSVEDLADHELYAWRAPGDDPRAWPLRAGGTFAAEPKVVSTDIHALRHCAIAGLGIALVPDAMLPDPGLPPDALIPVLPEVVGRERAVRVTVPEALSEVPKIAMVLARVRAFLGEL